MQDVVNNFSLPSVLGRYSVDVNIDIYSTQKAGSIICSLRHNINLDVFRNMKMVCVEYLHKKYLNISLYNS